MNSFYRATEKQSEDIVLPGSQVKRVLITGANSYIGTSIESYLLQWPDQYHIDTIDMIDESWRQKSFAGYDSVYHVAGIVHRDTSAIGGVNRRHYYAVNTDLAIEVAMKAKADGVSQFIFMSSMAVYGSEAKIGETRIITRDTRLDPVSSYGDSKMQAEKGIEPLEDDAFHVCILRPPMVYGPGCKGNYPILAKAARKLPFFPDIKNQRSMLFVGNLARYVKKVIDHRQSGVFFPQNSEYVCVSDMVRQIAKTHGKTIRLTKMFNPILRLLSKVIGLVNKVFGSLMYEQEGERIEGEVPFEESIVLTERDTTT